ncbi:hypothetical protein BBJ28_00021041 [Nothophytophthora sp. Chile5]|nr:hypothetical protein BBJ28_00021041 [Nothophytophthora sp. Chile5]
MTCDNHRLRAVSIITGEQYARYLRDRESALGKNEHLLELIVGEQIRRVDVCRTTSAVTGLRFVTNLRTTQWFGCVEGGSVATLALTKSDSRAEMADDIYLCGFFGTRDVDGICSLGAVYQVKPPPHDASKDIARWEAMRDDLLPKSQQPVRWLVLFLSCVLMIGNYYCFDNPAALKSQLQQHFNKIPKDRYEFLFVRSDENGSPLVTVEHSATQIIYSLVFGFGGESLGVAQGTLVASWFKNSELALALGINLSVARLGSVINNELSPVIAQASGVSSALWVGVIMCVMSTCTVLLVIPIDKQAEKVARANLKAGSAAVESIHFSDIKHFRPAFWLLALSCLVVYGCVIPFNSVASSLLMERDFFKEPPSLCRRCGDGLYIEEIDCREIAPGCPSVPPYGWPLPLLSANCTIKEPQDQWNCSTSPPLIDDSKINCDDEAWKLGPLTKPYCATKAAAARKAATPMSVPYIISAAISPFLGFAVDHIGLRALLALVAPLALTMVHVMLGLTDVSLYVPLVLQGVAYSVFAAALWPSVPCKRLELLGDVVEAKHVGTAYGAITAIQVSVTNIGLALFPLAVAAEFDHDERYIPGVELLFVSFGVVGSLVGVALNVVDYQNGSILNGTNGKKKRGSLMLDEEALDSEALLAAEH